MNLKVDTNQYHSLAHRVRNLINHSIALHSQNQRIRHGKIQSKLHALADYLETTAISFEHLESKRTSKDVNSVAFQKNTGLTEKSKKQKIHTYHSFHPNVESLALKGNGSAKAEAGMQYTYGKIHRVYGNEAANLTVNAAVGKVKAKGSAELSLWKDKKWDPKLKINAQAGVTALSGTIYGRAGIKNVYVDASATGDVGTVYANATAVITPNEQTIDAGIGASALKGEVKTSFHFFGANVTLTGQGSVGSAEANVSYHHRAREWEFGSKLGFIAGLGFKVRVNY